MKSDGDDSQRHPAGATSAASADAQRGLSRQEADRLLAVSGQSRGDRSSRSYASILRANALTVFNVILAGFGVVTLAFGDWRDALFMGVIAANIMIGVTQEVRAKRALDRLSLLIAPRARVRRDGAELTVAAGEVLLGDLVCLSPGEQLLADGHLVNAIDLRLDESILTGESRPSRRERGEPVRSGAFVVEGTGVYEVTATGAESYAARITGEASSFRHPRSPLERAVDRLLYALVGVVLALGALLGYSLYHRHVHIHAAVATATAGVVTMIPEGLVLLIALTYAAAAVRMSRHGVLVQQLNAIESLASVETLCIDKTGTLTEPALRVTELRPAPGVPEQELGEALGRIAAATSVRNLTVEAIAERFPTQSTAAVTEVPFSSRRSWSAVSLDDATYYLGAPERLPIEGLADAAAALQREGRRVLAAARSAELLSAQPGEGPPANLESLGLVALAEQLRPNVRETIAFLLREQVTIKVLSGDAAETVAAIARDAGIPLAGVRDGSEMPEDSKERRRFSEETTVIGRVSPEGKRAIVEALGEEGHYVAMIGDGVNDVPALKRARLAIAQGSGTQMARSVSDVVLISGDFASLPALVAEGRRALRNLQRVTKLYVTKSALAAFLILTIGTSSDAYPLLPRHLTLAATLTIGIPTFFLALAPSSGPWRPDQFVRSVARFSVPAGWVLGSSVVAGYLFALHDLSLGVADARTVAVTILVAGGMYLVLALESEGSPRRLTLVGMMCAVLGGLYAAALLLPATRRFFALTPPDPGMIATALLASALAIGALGLCGYSARVSRTDGKRHSHWHSLR